MDVWVESERHALPDGEVHLLGAVHTVTGAMTRVALPGASLLVDCGAAQGEDARGWTFPREATEVDAVILTHGHDDHVGSLVHLWRAGWKGPVLATAATLRIARIVIEDGLGLEGARRDVPGFMRWLDEVSRPMRYDEPGRHGLSLKGTFALREAGHILGSASVELVTEGSRLVVSGDLGRPGTPLLRDPNTRWDTGRPFDLVLMESTYGDTRHESRPGEVEERLLAALEHAEARGGHILVPAFAIGRTQHLLYLLNDLVESGRVRDLPVAVDTPMGLKVTETYRAFRRLFDREALDRIAHGDDPLLFDELYAVHHGHDSARLREAKGPILVIAGSGMCTGGRIVGHLEALLPREETVVLFVGYQARGTPGRAIQAARPGEEVMLRGHPVKVRARIETLPGLSAHADQAELVAWLRAVPQVRRVALHHGEPAAQRALRAAILAGGARPDGA